ncbi:MAG: hypothetical protein HY912_24460 [Desulfomonile tiedjei]|uniref:Uncharacterized protein n=1 Tax=Desulfomonile tiedjei TaxID=2358 RepID=A0A9D6Z923_9BACT|nr:hypothetical protein [Desulfomonile tiedjei]
MARLIPILLVIFSLSLVADMASARGNQRANIDRKWNRSQELEKQQDERFKALDAEAGKFMKNIDSDKGNRQPGVIPQ